MSKITLKLLLIGLIAFAYDRGLGWYLDTEYEQNEGADSNGHLNQFLHHSTTLDTLFIGSSRMAHHVDPDFFGDEAYNLSKSGMHIGYQAAVVDLIEQYNRLPTEVIVLHLEPEDMLLQYADKLTDDIHSLRYYYGSNDFITAQINNHSRFEFIKYYSQLYRHSGNGITLLMDPSQIKPTSNGYSSLNGKLGNEKIDTMKFDTPILYNEDFISFVDHIQVICKRNGIELICMTSPRMQLSTVRLNCAQILELVLKERNIPYFDYLNHPKKLDAERSYWSDRAHLNTEGSKLFTKKIRAALNALHE